MNFIYKLDSSHKYRFFFNEVKSYNKYQYQQMLKVKGKKVKTSV